MTGTALSKALAIFLVVSLQAGMPLQAVADAREDLEKLNELERPLGRFRAEQKCQPDLSAIEAEEWKGNWAAAFIGWGILHEIGICAELDYRKAFDYFERAAAAEGGCTLEMRLARMFLQGLGVVADEAEARRRLRKAALCFVFLLDSPEADVSFIARMTMHPFRVPKEFYEEYEWARSLNDADAKTHYRLAMQLRKGSDLLPKIPEVALSLLARAAFKNLPEAQFAYGQSLITGELGERDPFHGLQLIHGAAEQDYEPAQTDLGLRHIRGDLVEKSRVHAYLWLREALRNGADVADVLTQVEAAMSKEDWALADLIATPQYRPDREQLR